jgi:leader peptidase (prepilin peptidase)/N-methyltransferase
VTEAAVLLVFAVLLGTIVGSFLNVCIDRLPRGASLSSPPSQCEACGRRLSPLELIPVLSYTALRGRCRTCGARFPARVVAVEAGTGLAFLLVFEQFGLSLQAGLAIAYTCLLIVIGVIDLEHHRVLNGLTYPAIALALAAAAVTPGRGLLSLLLGGLIGGGALLLLALVSPRAMGFGDVKLSFFLGLVLGYPLVVVGLFLAFVVGGLVSLGQLAAGKVRRGDAVAFGPYLALAGFAALLYGDRLLTWWLSRV